MPSNIHFIVHSVYTLNAPSRVLADKLWMSAKPTHLDREIGI